MFQKDINISPAAAAQRDIPAVDDLIAPDDPQFIKEIHGGVAVGNDQFYCFTGGKRDIFGESKMSVFVAEIPGVDNFFNGGIIFDHLSGGTRGDINSFGTGVDGGVSGMIGTDNT